MEVVAVLLAKDAQLAFLAVLILLVVGVASDVIQWWDRRA